MKTRHILFGSALFFTFVSSQVHAAYDVWEGNAPYPVKIAGGTAASHDGIFYGISGGNCVQVPNINQVFGYSAASDAWEEKAPIPTARAFAGAVTIDGKIYVVGGCANSDCRAESTNLLEVYDVALNSWSAASTMQNRRAPGAVGVIDGKLYVAGGCGPGYVNSDALEVYSPGVGTWETKQPLPIALEGSMGAVVGRNLYVLGGYSRPINQIIDRVFKYNPDTDSWSEVEPMPTPRLQGGAGVVDGKIYVAGGHNSDGLISTVDIYDPASNTWTTLSSPLPTPRSNLALAVVRRTLYVAGGTGADNYCSDKFESYTPAPLYIFGGFLPPVSFDKPFKFGSTIPVKFQLTDDSGAYVTTAKATISLQKYSNDTPVGDAIDAVSTTGADAGNIFRYDNIDNQYIFNLNTKKMSAGTWQIRVVLGDGTETKTSFISLK